MEQNNSKGLAIAAMVLGICSIVLSCIPYICYLTPAMAIVGIVLAAKAKKKQPSGMATAGLVCSIVALAIDVVLIILAIIGLGLLASIASAL